MSYTLAKRARRWMEGLIHTRSPEAILDPADFPWVAQVEGLYPRIRQEAHALLPSLPGIPNFDDVLQNQRALQQKDAWKSFFLVALGHPVDKHQKLCPAACEALQNIPGLINAFFSILAPGAVIPPHRGPYAGILRYHLGLIVPKGDLAIRVNGQTCRWVEGKSLVFDDSFEHEVWNRTEETRVILFVDLLRPLSPPLSLVNEALVELFKHSSEAREGYCKVMKTQMKE